MTNRVALGGIGRKGHSDQAAAPARIAVTAAAVTAGIARRHNGNGGGETRPSLPRAVAVSAKDDASSTTKWTVEISVRRRRRSRSRHRLSSVSTAGGSEAGSLLQSGVFVSTNASVSL